MGHLRSPQVWVFCYCGYRAHRVIHQQGYGPCSRCGKPMRRCTSYHTTPRKKQSWHGLEARKTRLALDRHHPHRKQEIGRRIKATILQRFGANYYAELGKKSGAQRDPRHTHRTFVDLHCRCGFHTQRAPRSEGGYGTCNQCGAALTRKREAIYPASA